MPAKWMKFQNRYQFTFGRLPLELGQERARSGYLDDVLLALVQGERLACRGRSVLGLACSS